MSHKTNQKQPKRAAGPMLLLANKKCKKDGVPLLNHQLIDNSAPEGAGPVTSVLFAGGPATITLSYS